MNNLRKPISPVLSAVILAATIIAVGVIVLMWISGHSSMVIRQSQIDLIRSEKAAKENLVIVHAIYDADGNKVIIYLINMGHDRVFLGPIRIPEIRSANYEDIFTPGGIWFNPYTVYVNDTDNVFPEMVEFKVGGFPEYLENLDIRDYTQIPEDKREVMRAYSLKPYNTVGYYRVEIPVTLSTGVTYSVEIWSLVPIQNKLYLCKLYATQITT
ncbi:MAG: hypothetical protein DRN04_16685 [Thermoprotei archaeon]|nr:MAG: hypothetical protein DRN04_16685 [Thermoprotei archaeon]